MTAEFLEFSASAGNDLSTPRPEWGFAGLSPGDRWCVCAARWLEAREAGCAPGWSSAPPTRGRSRWWRSRTSIAHAAQVDVVE